MLIKRSSTKILIRKYQKIPTHFETTQELWLKGPFLHCSYRKNKKKNVNKNVLVQINKKILEKISHTLQINERKVHSYVFNCFFFFNTDRKSSYDLYQNRSIYPSGYIYFFFSLYECTNRTNFVLNLARTSVLPLRGVLMPIVLSTVVPVRVLYCVLKFCSYRCTTTTLVITFFRLTHHVSCNI